MSGCMPAGPLVLEPFLVSPGHFPFLSSFLPFEKKMTKTIDNLPDFVLERIFTLLELSFLVNYVQFVNKRWNALIRASSLWHSFRYVHLDENSISCQFAQKVLEKCGNLEHLVMIMSQPLPSSHCPAFTKPCLPRLHSASFYYFTADKMVNTIINIIKKSPHLQSITLDGVITQELVDAISNLKELSSINFRQTDYLESVSLTRLYRECSKLEVIKVSGWFDHSTEEINTLEYYCSPTLKSIGWRYSINDNYVKILPRWTALSELTLELRYLTIDSLKMIQKLSSLTCLSLENSIDLSSEDLKRFFEDGYFPKLNRLCLVNLENLTDPVLDTISCKYPNLEALELSCLYLAPIEGVRRFVRCCGCIRVLKLSLQKIDFFFTNDLSNYLHRLTYLKLYIFHLNYGNFSKKFLMSHPNYKGHEYINFNVSTYEIEDLHERHLKCSHLRPVLVLENYRDFSLFKIVPGYQSSS